ncbi:MAG TPA: hypothetical protein VMI56_07445 [Reyranella sp.]|nr:hypothetical protein [Reyranella sp.]
MTNEIDETERYRVELEQKLRSLIKGIGTVPIGRPGQFPYGWRKAAKGRTVWRILEEIISQNLEAKASSLGLNKFAPADSEVGVYDFSFRFKDSKTIYVNIKSAIEGRSPSKDDISKADKLVAFFKETKDLTLFVATIEIRFLADPLGIEIVNCYVVPTAWLPDVYVNPSNNANLQSSKYKDVAAAVRRGRAEFVTLLEEQLEIARQKRSKKR